MVATPDTPKLGDITLSPINSQTPASSSSVPFPSSKSDNPSALQDSESSSSNQTSSDKLSALPVQSSPVLGRLRSPARATRRSLDTSNSLPSIDSPSGSLHALHHIPGASRASESEGSIGTPRQRASVDSDHPSLPATLQGIRHAIAARRKHRSHSATRSPSPLSGEGSLRGGNTPVHPTDPRQTYARNLTPHQGRETQTPTSRSPSQSRATSPLRRLGWALHRPHAREDPFVPVDPFRMGSNGRGRRIKACRNDQEGDDDIGCNDAFVGCLPLPTLCSQETERGEKDRSRWCSIANDVQLFMTDTLPRQAYLILLLGLPALYWSRVARVFEDAELSRPDVQRMIDACVVADETAAIEAAGLRGRSMPHRHTVLLPFPEEWNPPTVSPALVRFKHSWEQFVDSLLREWKTLNLVSALLCTAILTMFQVNDAEDDPLTRSAALFGLIFALMSLSYGCVYIVQFGTMRSMDRASRWAEEAQKTKTAILWNIWVLLATPAIWLAWSMIAFCVSILSYVWRTGSVSDTNPPSPLSKHQAIGVRAAITAVFVLGLLNFAMIIRTFRSYHGARRRLQDDLNRLERGREADTGRERRDGLDETRERDSKVMSPSMVGLGLTGLSETGMGSPAMASLAGIVREEADMEKGDFLSAEKGRGRARVSPKL